MHICTLVLRDWSPPTVGDRLITSKLLALLPLLHSSVLKWKKSLFAWDTFQQHRYSAACHVYQLVATVCHFNDTSLVVICVHAQLIFSLMYISWLCRMPLLCVPLKNKNVTDLLWENRSLLPHSLYPFTHWLNILLVTLNLYVSSSAWDMGRNQIWSKKLKDWQNTPCSYVLVTFVFI